MKRAYILYNKRSCQTGKALFDFLKDNRIGGYLWRRANRRPPDRDHNLVLRWGNSYLPTSINSQEINNRDAVATATDKLSMINYLDRAEGVTIPEMVLFPMDNDHSHVLVDGHGYYRNRADKVHYRNHPVEGDKYVLKPIDKVREFRVHIFNGKTLGVYEKIPKEEGVMIYKNANCDFKRLDMGNKEQRHGVNGVRPMAKAAVNYLGLLFGGVDVLMDDESNIFVTEVNSAPALNELNVDRWGESIQQYIDTLVDQEV